MSNDNTPEYLEKIRSTISERLRTLPFAPSVQMHDVPRHGLGGSEEDGDILADMDADENMDVRMTELQQDRQVANDAEFYDSDVEDEKNKHLATRPEEAEALDEEMADVEDRESGEEASRKLTQPELPATNGDADEPENTRSGSIVVCPSETSAVVLDHASAEESSILPGTGNTTTPPRSLEPEEASAAEAATEVTEAAMEDTSEAPTAANVPTESIEPTTEVAETSTTAEAADPRSPSATPPRATE